MESKLDNLISKYSTGLVQEQDGLPTLPPLPADTGAVTPTGPPVTEPAPKEVEVEVAGPDLVNTVKTMLELLSYGLSADEGAHLQQPIANFLKLKDNIDDKNALKVIEDIENFLAQES